MSQSCSLQPSIENCTEKNKQRQRIYFLTTALLLTALMLMPNSVCAKDVVPVTAGKFAAFCTPLNDACRNKIVEVEANDRISAMANNEPFSDCEVPEGVEPEQGYKAIVSWLLSHHEAANSTTEAGINAAIQALWNCRKSIATGKSDRR